MLPSVYVAASSSEMSCCVRRRRSHRRICWLEAGQGRNDSLVDVGAGRRQSKAGRVSLAVTKGFHQAVPVKVCLVEIKGIGLASSMMSRP